MTDIAQIAHITRLVEELRHGGWQQIHHQLREEPGWNQQPAGYCCLGVACEIAMRYDIGHRFGDKYWSTVDEMAAGKEGNESDLPAAVMEWYGFGESNPVITILCADISYDAASQWCEVCRNVYDTGDDDAVEIQHGRCTVEMHVAAAEANDELGCNFEQIAAGFERRYLMRGNVATPQN